MTTPFELDEATCTSARSAIAGARPDAPRALNGMTTQWTKTMTSESTIGSRLAGSRRRRSWASLAIALVVVACVLAIELWAARHASTLETTAKSEVVTALDTTLAGVAQALAIAPAE